MMIVLTACSQEPESMQEVNLDSCESDTHLTPINGDNVYGYDDNGTIWYCYCGIDD